MSTHTVSTNRIRKSTNRIRKWRNAWGLQYIMRTWRWRRKTSTLSRSVDCGIWISADYLSNSDCCWLLVPCYSCIGPCSRSRKGCKIMASMLFAASTLGQEEALMANTLKQTIYVVLRITESSCVESRDWSCTWFLAFIVIMISPHQGQTDTSYPIYGYWLCFGMGFYMDSFHDTCFLARILRERYVGLPDSPSRSLQRVGVHVPESEKREAIKKRREPHAERRKEENGGKFKLKKYSYW